MFRTGIFPKTRASGHIRWNALLQTLTQFTISLLVFAMTVSCWPGKSLAQASSPQSPAYEIASVRPSAPDVSGAGMTDIAGNRFVAKNLSVQQMVSMAYDIETDDLISNLPQWTNSARFDVQARLEDEKGHQGEIQRTRVVLRELLVDRFKLESHYEKRDRRVYVLVADKHGPKVQKAAATDDVEMSVRRGDVHLRATTMAPFVQGISLMVGRPVIDKTGLTEHYNIDFKCTPDELASTGDAGPSMLTLLKEQLGLRLLPTKSPVDVLVIDRLEMPSAN